VRFLLAGNFAIFGDPRVRPFAASRSDFLLGGRIGYAWLAGRSDRPFGRLSVIGRIWPDGRSKMAGYGRKEEPSWDTSG
jgi:hypothetical protein